MPERLADRLASGRLPLLYALHYATDLASGLRDLHAAGAAHGSVTPVFVALESEHAVLMPVTGGAGIPTADGDARCFGAVLYEMLVGHKPGPGAFAPTIVRSPYDAPWTEVYNAALGIAEKCLAASPNSTVNLQNVANELRLLVLIASRPLPAPPRWTAPGQSRVDAPAEYHPEPEPAADWNSLTDLICPSCGTQDVHWSGLRTPLERFLGRLGIPFYRCHRCFHRYMVVLGIRVTMVTPV